MTADPTVEQWARRPAPDELVVVSTTKTGRTSRRKRPAALLAERARELGWTVALHYARGPVTVGKRAEEPNANGVRSTIPVTTVEDTLALRLADPAGTRLVALWAAGKCEAWRWVDCSHPAGRCPRISDDDPRVACNVRRITADALKTLIEQGPRTEGEPAMPEEKDDERRSTIEEEAWRALDTLPDIPDDVGEIERYAFVEGYKYGHAAAVEKAGDAYGEGYAAGLAAALGHDVVWVKARRRLSQLKPGDVILGKGARWWIVESAAATDGVAGRSHSVTATSGGERVVVPGHPSRMVDVVEQIAVADALAALKAEGIEPERSVA